MKKFWLVFRYEYLRHVLRKRFLFALLSIPLFVLLTIGIGFLAVILQTDQRPAGYVDLSGRLANARPATQEQDALIPNTTFQAFDSAETARKALDSGAIQGYFVLADDYLKSGKIQYVTAESIKDNTRSDFQEFLRYNLASELPAEVAARVVEGPEYVIRSLDGTRSTGESDFLSILVPFVSGLIFVLVINISGSYLVQALIEEKENRTMEIVVTSVSPGQLMAGKVVGNLSVGLTQLVIWIVVGLIGLWFARKNLNFSLQIDPQLILISALTLLPAFVMVAGLMATAGATTTDSREAQQVAGYFTLPVVIPYWFIGVLMRISQQPACDRDEPFPTHRAGGLTDARRFHRSAGVAIGAGDRVGVRRSGGSCVDGGANLQAGDAALWTTPFLERDF